MHACCCGPECRFKAFDPDPSIRPSVIQSVAGGHDRFTAFLADAALLARPSHRQSRPARCSKLPARRPALIPAPPSSYVGFQRLRRRSWSEVSHRPGAVRRSGGVVRDCFLAVPCTPAAFYRVRADTLPTTMWPSTTD
jgi:hypothetical protein